MAFCALSPLSKRKWKSPQSSTNAWRNVRPCPPFPPWREPRDRKSRGQNGLLHRGFARSRQSGSGLAAVAAHSRRCKISAAREPVRQRMPSLVVVGLVVFVLFRRRRFGKPVWELTATMRLSSWSRLARQCSRTRISPISLHWDLKDRRVCSIERKKQAKIGNKHSWRGLAKRIRHVKFL